MLSARRAACYLRLAASRARQIPLPHSRPSPQVLDEPLRHKPPTHVRKLPLQASLRSAVASLNRPHLPPFSTKTHVIHAKARRSPQRPHCCCWQAPVFPSSGPTDRPHGGPPLRRSRSKGGMAGQGLACRRHSLLVCCKLPRTWRRRRSHTTGLCAALLLLTPSSSSSSPTPSKSLAPLPRLPCARRRRIPLPVRAGRRQDGRDEGHRDDRGVQAPAAGGGGPHRPPAAREGAVGR